MRNVLCLYCKEEEAKPEYVYGDFGFCSKFCLDRYEREQGDER